MSADTNQSNRNWIIVLIILLLVLPLCCLGTLCASFTLGIGAMDSSGDLGNLNIIDDLSSLADFNRASVTKTVEREFDVHTGHVTLTVDIEVGSVSIETGGDREVIVEADLTAYGEDEDAANEAMDNLDLRFTPTDNEIAISSHWPKPDNWSHSTPKVELRLTVPDDTAVDIKLDVGDVDVKDTESDLDIQVSVGDVDVRDVKLEDAMAIDVSTGSIKYRGDLTEGTRYQLTTSIGQVVMEIPDDSSFDIDATADVGEVQTDFEIVGEEDVDFVGNTLQGTVGDAGTGTELILSTDIGVVKVKYN